MRKTFGGLLAAAALLVPAGASAQSGDVTATATVVAALQVFEESDLNFGAVVPGVDASVALGSAPATGSLGHLRIQHSSNFTVTSGVPAVLSDGGVNTIAVSFLCGYSSTQNGAISGGSFDCASPNASPATAPGAATTTWLQVGGTILGTASSGAAPGVYNGTLSFTFTATL